MQPYVFKFSDGLGHRKVSSRINALSSSQQHSSLKRQRDSSATGTHQGEMNDQHSKTLYKRKEHGDTHQPVRKSNVAHRLAQEANAAPQRSKAKQQGKGVSCYKAPSFSHGRAKTSSKATGAATLGERPSSSSDRCPSSTNPQKANLVSFEAHHSSSQEPPVNPTEVQLHNSPAVERMLLAVETLLQGTQQCSA